VGSLVAVCLALAVAGAGLKRYFDRQARRDEARRLTQEATTMEHWGNFGHITGAMERLNKAMALDPSSALVHARIAETMLRAGQTDPGQERIEAERSVRMDPGCGECQAILGWILFSREWKWQEAADHLRRANQLNPRTRMRTFGIRNYWLPRGGCRRLSVTWTGPFNWSLGTMLTLR
jgi:Tfp pilus assembly protein PilF